MTILIPVGVGYQAAKTAGTSIPQAIGVELVKDSISAGSGYVAGQVGTHYGTEWFGADAGKWIGLGSGLVAGFGTSGGLNRIDKLYNVNGAHSFVEAMSPNDAIQYNKYWNNVEAGKYDIPYGMNANQYTQYVKGLQNVQDATVSKSFDYNELFELRNKGSIKTPSEMPQSWQGTGKYPGVDKYMDITIKKDKIIYRGEPNGTEYFTTKSAIERSGRDATKIFEGLQVEKNMVHGYRSNMQGYKATIDIDAAFGISKSNPQFGGGGLPQIFTPGADDLISKGYLVPIDIIPLIK
ncbi:MAG: hypothetical protein WAX04_11840 [Oscillospiraceae bacterium]